MGYKLILGMEKKELNNSSVRDINKAIDSLDHEHENPFVVLEVSKENNEFIQVFYYKDRSDDILKYRIEFRRGTFNDYRHYKLILTDKNEIKKMFEKALLSQEFPAPDSWEDITHEMTDYNNKHDYFNIFEYAKNNHRAVKEIIDCYGFSHGTVLNETTIYQNIAEAIILCKSILNTDNSLSGIYYTEDRMNYYIDIKFPPEWKECIPQVDRIRGLLTNNMIQIGSYDNENSFIDTNIYPISEHEKLLTCIILLFVKLVLTDEDYIFKAMNYFYRSKKEQFEEIYIKFLKNLENTDYFIGYEDGSDFNYSRYLSLSELYNNFVDNTKEKM